MGRTPDTESVAELTFFACEVSEKKKLSDYEKTLTARKLPRTKPGRDLVSTGRKNNRKISL